jgi:hypothetical protein
MKRPIFLVLLTLVLAMLACENGGTTQSTPPPEVPPEAQTSIFETGRTAFGFFPSPPVATTEAVLNHFVVLGEHADFILIQPNIPWEDFVNDVNGDTQASQDLRNQVILATQNGLEWIFVVDPLNGLNRREFFGLPAGWKANFANQDVRQAFTNFTLWIIDEFQPRYLGLASEVNTYMDAHPDDVPNYLSLYRQVYDRVKGVSPETQVFVTFQWDDLNNMFAPAAEGREAYDTNWEQVEAFEPQLDLWAISSYPYFVFPSGEGIPSDYYIPLLARTSKPLAVAEGGFSSRPIGPITASPEDQSAYLQAIHDQLGERLAFWVNLILDDLDMNSIEGAMRDQGRTEADVETLSLFAYLGLRESDGTPKPALELWNEYREEE